MLLPHGCIIALVDGENFTVYRNAGSEAEPRLQTVDVTELDSSNHSDVGHRSSHGNHADSLVNEDAHAKAAAGWLNAEVLGHRIDDLVILAPPRTLGELRKHYHPKTREVLRCDLAKDLAGFAPRDIIAALREQP